MRGDDSYAVLGLRPGAPRAEIDQAYRRLIKRYHPDHAGGDAGRAAEVNRAYTELRSLARQPQRQQRPPPPSTSPPGRPRQIAARRGPSWLGPAVALAGLSAAVLLAQSADIMGPVEPSWQWSSSGDSAALGGGSARRAALSFNLDDPISTEMIDRSIDDAVSLDVAENPALAAEVSRDCLSRLSSSPSLPLFDSCAAYDEAVAILTADNPAFDSGPFNPLAVTARQVGAARLLSADHVESESRLQQIRSRVQMVLFPRLADSGRVIRPKALASAPPPIVSRPPVIAVASQPRVAAPRQRLRPSVSAPKARVRPAHAQPQPARPSVAVERRPAATVRPPAPAPQRAVQPPPQAQPAKVPEWQKPIKPAWQRPLRAAE